LEEFPGRCVCGSASREGLHLKRRAKGASRKMVATVIGRKPRRDRRGGEKNG